MVSSFLSVAVIDSVTNIVSKQRVYSILHFQVTIQQGGNSNRTIEECCSLTDAAHWLTLLTD